MRRFRVEVAYDGGAYHGWQVQPGLPTIQGVLEQVISDLEGRRVGVEGSGRTDAGVHALAQVAAFSLSNPIPAPNLMKALNRQLPRDIRINRVEEASPAFHPRFDARAKIYEYRILRAEVCPPFERQYVLHHPYPLEEDTLIRLAPMLEGEHDFSAFASSDEKDELGYSKVRTIFESRFRRRDDLLIYRVRGSGFLKHMVRNIVGVLLEAGKGNLNATDLAKRLQPGSGIAAGPSTPARGLFLMCVEY